MSAYDYIERYGCCEECGAAWYATGTLEGCSSAYCDLYVSAEAHAAEETSVT